MTKLPALVTVSVLPLMLPLAVLLESMVNTTAFPDALPVADNGMVKPEE